MRPNTLRILERYNKAQHEDDVLLLLNWVATLEDKILVAVEHNDFDLIRLTAQRIVRSVRDAENGER